MLQINIAVYTKDYENNRAFYKFCAYFKEEGTEYKRPLMVMLYDNNLHHFTQLHYNDKYNYKESNIINFLFF